MTTTSHPDPPVPPTRPVASRPHVTVAVPPRWRRRSDPDLGVLVAARAPTTPASGIRAEVTLRCVLVDAVDLVTWRDSALRRLGDLLVDLALEDDAEYDLLGREVAYRRFAHRVGTADVLCDQWAWLVDGFGVTLTCSVARQDYPGYVDLFEAIAETVEIGA